MKGLLQFTVLALMIGAGRFVRGDEFPSEPPANTLARHLPEGVTICSSLAYVPGGGERQQLDIYLPAPGGASITARPLVVFVHGGGWVCGSKADVPQCLGTLLTHGYVVASLSYRLSQDARFPAQLEDCKAAIRWVRAHAAEYGIDRERIGVWGPSAGGHLAALLGTTAVTRRFDVGENLSCSSAVQAVVDYYGPTDLSQMQAHALRGTTLRHDGPASPEAKLIGGAVDDPAWAAAVQQANPVHFLTPAAPPFLLVHGDRDPTVPHQQSELLYHALVAACVPVRFITVHGGGHGDGFPVADLAADVLDFFDHTLRGRPNDPHAPVAVQTTVTAVR